MPRDSTKGKVYQKGICSRSSIQGDSEQLLQFLSRFSFIVKSAVIISCHDMN